jgi:hypothetical protein
MSSLLILFILSTPLSLYHHRYHRPPDTTGEHNREAMTDDRN